MDAVLVMQHVLTTCCTLEYNMSCSLAAKRYMPCSWAELCPEEALPGRCNPISRSSWLGICSSCHVRAESPAGMTQHTM